MEGSPLSLPPPLEEEVEPVAWAISALFPLPPRSLTAGRLLRKGKWGLHLLLVSNVVPLSPSLNVAVYLWFIFLDSMHSDMHYRKGET